MGNNNRLNIKRPEAYQLAKRLSVMTGQTLTAVVLTALREQLETERKARGVDQVPRRPSDHLAP